MAVKETHLTVRTAWVEEAQHGHHTLLDQAKSFPRVAFAEESLHRQRPPRPPGNGPGWDTARTGACCFRPGSWWTEHPRHPFARSFPKDAAFRLDPMGTTRLLGRRLPCPVGAASEGAFWYAFAGSQRVSCRRAGLRWKRSSVRLSSARYFFAGDKTRTMYAPVLLTTPESGVKKAQYNFRPAPPPRARLARLNQPARPEAWWLAGIKAAATQDGVEDECVFTRDGCHTLQVRGFLQSMVVSSATSLWGMSLQIGTLIA